MSSKVCAVSAVLSRYCSLDQRPVNERILASKVVFIFFVAAQEVEIAAALVYRLMDAVCQQRDAGAIGGEARVVARVVQIDAPIVVEREIGRSRLIIYFQDRQIEPAGIEQAIGHIEEKGGHALVHEASFVD